MGDEWTRVIKEKDEQIAQLMEEGEKLSKQELQSNSIIKKLRQKDKQNDQLLAAQRYTCLLYTSPSPRDATLSRMPSSA